MGTTSDKLTYLNTTKTKIKDAINLANTNITNETFRQYESKIKQALINTMNDKWGTWVNFEKVTGTGETLTLTPTSEAPMKIDLKGNTSQYTTTGNNYFDSSFTNTTHGNVSFTYNSGVITLNGAYSNQSGTVEVISSLNNYLPAGTYTMIFQYISGTQSGNSMRLSIGNSSMVITTDNENRYFSTAIQNGNTSNVVVTNTFSEAKTINKWGLFINPSASFSNYKFRLYIVSGTYTTSSFPDYEPYTGGNPAPNPSYPQPINVVTGDNNIVICGKNLYDKSKVAKGYLDNDGTTTTGNTNDRVTPYIKVQPNTTYCLSGLSTMFSKVCTYNSSETFINVILTSSQGATRTFTTPNNCEYIRVAVSDYNSAYEIQLEKSNQATSYEAYQSQTYPIYLGVENLFNKNNITTGSFYVAGGTSSSDNWALETIPVKPNTQYYLSGNNYNNNVARIVLLDSSKSYLQDLGGYHDTHLITTSSTTAYIGLSVAIYSGSSDLDTLQLTKGTTPQHISTTPIELCKIGDYQDEILKSSGKNLYNGTYTTKKFVNKNNGNIGDSADWSATDYIEIEPNTNYTYSGITNGSSSGAGTAFYDSNNAFISSVSTQTYSFTTPNNAKYVRISLNSETPTNIMLNKGTTALPYEPYGNVWYLHKEIGKVVLNGSENWIKSGTYQGNYYANVMTNIKTNINLTPKYSNLTKNFITYVSQLNDYDNALFFDGGPATYNVNFKVASITTLQDFKDYLGTTNLIIYYQLNAPYLSLIEDTTLINQLDNLQSAMSYKGQTNIMQLPYDKPFIIIASALKAI